MTPVVYIDLTRKNEKTKCIMHYHSFPTIRFQRYVFTKEHTGNTVKGLTIDDLLKIRAQFMEERDGFFDTVKCIFKEKSWYASHLSDNGAFSFEDLIEKYQKVFTLPVLDNILRIPYSQLKVLQYDISLLQYLIHICGPEDTINIQMLPHTVCQSTVPSLFLFEYIDKIKEHAQFNRNAKYLASGSPVEHAIYPINEYLMEEGFIIDAINADWIIMHRENQPKYILEFPDSIEAAENLLHTPVQNLQLHPLANLDNEAEDLIQVTDKFHFTVVGDYMITRDRRVTKTPEKILDAYGNNAFGQSVYIAENIIHSIDTELSQYILANDYGVIMDIAEHKQTKPKN